MGQTLLVIRLAARDIRRHKAQAVLLLLAITAATTVLALGLALHGVTSRPYQQTRTQTRGPDVVAYLASPGQAAALIHASGVTAASGPYPLAYTVLQADGRTAGAEVEGRTVPPAAVDQPELTAGHWVRPGGVVIEREFAEALGVSVGDRIALNGQSFTVAGIAVSAAKPPYPNICFAGGCELFLNGVHAKNTGLIWATEPDAIKLPVAAEPLNSYVLNLKLADPDQAQAFASRYGSGPNGPILVSWPDIAASDALLVSDEQSVLIPGAALLCLLALASVAVLVGSRLAGNTRRVGLLKAAGATPGLIAATFLAENLLLALVAAAAGLTAGVLTAPLLTSPGAALTGAPGAPSLTPLMVVAVLAVALAVTLASTLTPAIRAARSSTVRALASTARPPRRHGALIRLSSKLPVPVLFGLRIAARRPRRALLSAASIAVTVTGIVALLAFHATAGQQRVSGPRGLSNPVLGRDEQILTVLTVVLLTLSVLNASCATWATVLDTRRVSALSRALGATPRQLSAGLAAAQVIPALPGALLGIPLGIELFAVANSAGIVTVPSARWLLATVAGTLVGVAALTTIPARIGARRSVAEILRSETA